MRERARPASEAVALAARYRPHVALVDLFIGEESGAEVCERLRAAEPSDARAAVLGRGRDLAAAPRAPPAPRGSPTRTGRRARSPSAVRAVGLGKIVFDRHDRQGALGLSERERAVLELMASGSTNPEIAERLHLSKHTVKEHTSSVYRKLGVRNRTEAVQRSQRLGLLG